METVKTVCEWLANEQPNICGVENISGFGFIFLAGSLIFVVMMAFSKRLRDIFF